MSENLSVVVKFTEEVQWASYKCIFVKNSHPSHDLQHLILEEIMFVFCVPYLNKPENRLFWSYFISNCWCIAWHLDVLSKC